MRNLVSACSPYRPCGRPGPRRPRAEPCRAGRRARRRRTRRPAQLLGMGGERRQRLRFGQPVQHQIDGAGRLRGGQQLDPPVGVPPIRWKRMLSTPTRSGPRLSVWPGADGPSGPPTRHIHAHLGRLAVGRITRRGVEDVDQHIALRHGVDRRRRTDEVDPELLVRLGGSWARVSGLLNGRSGVEDGQLQGEATIQLRGPGTGCGSRDRSCPSPPRTCPGADRGHRKGRWDRSGRDRAPLAVGVHEPAPGAAADGLPIGDRAGLEVLHDDRARLIVGRIRRVASDENRAQRQQRRSYGRSSRDPHSRRLTHIRSAVSGHAY